jgi:hypothetical protein
MVVAAAIPPAIRQASCYCSREEKTRTRAAAAVNGGRDTMTTSSRHQKYLTDRQFDDYREDGFLTLKGMCSLKEIRSWQGECRRLWESVEISDDNPRLRWGERVDGTRVADRIHPVLDISPLFERLAHDDRFVRAAADVMDGEPQVLTASLESKWPGTRGQRLHQDYTQWTFDRELPYDDFVKVLIPIAPLDGASGAVEVFAGYHHRVLSGPAGAPVDESAVAANRRVVLSLDPGDVGLIHGLTPHRGGPNRTATQRELLLVTYIGAGYDHR